MKRAGLDLKYCPQISIAVHGQAPSYEEIMVSLGFDSLGTVNWYVKTLEDQGHLSRVKGPNGKRALILTHKEHATTTNARLPLLGLIFKFF